MGIHVRHALAQDAEAVSSTLIEAAAWLDARGMGMWRADELSPDRIRRDVSDGLFFVAESAGTVVGTIKIQMTDPLFWPDLPEGDAAYLHRLAVRRDFSGGVVSQVLLAWAAEHARSLSRRFLRLDCEAHRARLRVVYERSGFRHHSDRQVGPYFVARYERDLTIDSTGRGGGA